MDPCSNLLLQLQFQNLGSFCPPLCLSSLSCINEDLAIDSGGYVNEYSLSSNCGVAEFFPQKSNCCCQGVKCKALIRNLILCYIRTYLYVPLGLCSLIVLLCNLFTPY